MQHLFSILDSLLELPYPAFEKKLAKVEEDFKDISLGDISEEELESFFEKIRSSYDNATWERARTHLAVLWYISHFDTLIEKYFPDYVGIFQKNLIPERDISIDGINYVYLTHLDEILREYTHRLSDPDQYPSYTNYIQEMIQNAMIELFFWLQDREEEAQNSVKIDDKNTDILIKMSSDTQDPYLKMIRRCLELLGEWVLEKILYDLNYQMRVSSSDPELVLIGRYEKK